jgi:ferredoxin-thioredoxin reductase catalytic subunit
METVKGMKKYVETVSQRNNWLLNKDHVTFYNLIDGLIENKKSYGYQSCPCRLASGNRELDRDLICPCDYASDDIKEFGACYCNLYQRSDYYESIKGDFVNVPERRPLEKDEAVSKYFREIL